MSDSDLQFTLNTVNFATNLEMKDTLVEVPNDEQEIVDKYYRDIDPDSVVVDETENRLGNGGYATVWTAVVGGKRLAFKKHPSSSLVKSAKDKVRREVAIARMLSPHPHIHRTEGGVFGSSKNGILMKLANQDLQSFCQERGKLLVDNTGTISKKAQLMYYRQLCAAFLSVARALQFMHNYNIIHCDVKPQNVLVYKTGERLEFTLCDFGSAAIVADSNKLQTPRILSGTTHYLPPESLSVPKELLKQFNQTTQSNRPLVDRKAVVSGRTDVWSLGCTMLTSLNYGLSPIVKQFPRPDDYLQHMLPLSIISTSTLKTADEATQGPEKENFTVAIQSDCPKLFFPLVSRCLITNPAERPKISQVIEALEKISKELDETDYAGDYQEAHVSISTDRGSMRPTEVEVLAWDKMKEEILTRDGRMEAVMNEMIDGFNEYLQFQERSCDSMDENEVEVAEAIMRRSLQEVNRNIDLSSLKPTGSIYVSSGILNGQPVFEGPKGGQFVFNSKGSKVYVTDKAKETAPRATKTPITTSRASVSSTKTSSVAESKFYQPERDTPTGRTYQSSGSANGREIYTGTRGGEYYYTESGNRRYISESTSSSSSANRPTPSISKASSSSASSASSTYRATTSAPKASSSSSSSSSSSYSYSTPSRSSHGGTPTGTTYQSSGSANGRALYTGSRGGTYYINSSGNKSYVRK